MTDSDASASDSLDDAVSPDEIEQKLAADKGLAAPTCEPQPPMQTEGLRRRVPALARESAMDSDLQQYKEFDGDSVSSDTSDSDPDVSLFASSWVDWLVQNLGCLLTHLECSFSLHPPASLYEPQVIRRSC
jgi:hypothetical protein